MLTRIAKHDFGGEIRQIVVSLIDDAVHADTILILFFAAGCGAFERDIVERVDVISEPDDRPTVGDDEIRHGALHAIGPQKRIGVRKVVEHQESPRLDLRGGSVGVAQHAFVRMVRVDINPIEMRVGKACEHTMRGARMHTHAGVLRNRGIELREVEVDDMKLGRRAGV